MLDKLQALESTALADLQSAQDEAALQEWKVKYLGRSAELSRILDELRDLPKEQRPAVGRRANEVKGALESAYQERLEGARSAALVRTLREDRLDVTLPGATFPLGRLHPATQTLRQIYRIWAEMGFQVYRSRDVETDEYNFELLNMPAHHPARDMWDTFYTTDPGRAAAHAHLARPDPRHARTGPGADPRDPARHVLPLRAGHRPLGSPVQPGGGSGGGQGTSPWPTSRAR